MNVQRPYLVPFVSRAERRKAQNRLNQRALRRRIAERDASGRLEDQCRPRGEASDSNSSLEGALPYARNDTEPRDDIDIEQLRALSASLSSSLSLDQARTLSPLLADPRVRKVWSMATNTLWPRLEYTDERDHRGLQTGELTRAFFRHSLADPLLFNAQTCSTSTAIAMSNCDPHTMHYVATYHETEAVKLLRLELTNPSQTPRDELLFAMLLLTTSDKANQPLHIVIEKKSFGAFRPPLTSLHNLEIGSSLRLSDLHRGMLKRMVAQKGGITEISMPCLGEFFNTMDLYLASLRCEKPDFGLCKEYLACLESDVLVIRRRHQQETIHHFGFRVLDLEDTFHNLLWDIRCYMDMVKAYCQGAFPKPPHVPLARYRNLVQHRILSIDGDASNTSRELCRLATLLFSCVVVYPLQNLVPLQRYLDELTQLLRSTRNIDDDFHFWLLMLGAMAADQMPLQLWYISELKLLAPRYGKAWSPARRVLESFLWLDMACGEGALEMWHLVMLC